MSIICVVCGIVAKKQSRSKFPEHCSKCSLHWINKAYREANAAKVLLQTRERARRWWQSNREKANSQKTHWVTCNPEKHKKSREKVYARQKKERSEKILVKKIRTPNVVDPLVKEARALKARACTKAWKKANPEAHASHMKATLHKRRAQKRESIGTFTSS